MFRIILIRIGVIIILLALIIWRISMRMDFVPKHSDSLNIITTNTPIK